MNAQRIAFAMFLAAAGMASAAQYQIDPAHSNAQFKVRHMMVSNVRGEFGKVTGTVVFDANNAAASHIDATIDATTVNTHEPDRDKDLKSANFFDVDKYPTITFQSTKVTSQGNGKYQVAGNLTIHGVTKPVVLAVSDAGNEVKDPWGNLRMGATAVTHVNRQDFGLVWNKSLDGGGVVVGDDVEITLDVEMTRPAAKSGD